MYYGLRGAQSGRGLIQLNKLGNVNVASYKCK